MDKDQKFRHALKQSLDRQTVDEDTRQALRTAREAALDQSNSPSRGSRWISATAVAGLVLAIIVVLLYRNVNDDQLPHMAADDLTVIASEAELELLEELEFYLWFDEEAQV